MMRAAIIASALSLAGCYNTDESPGRRRVIGESFECAQAGTITRDIRAVFVRHGSPVREMQEGPAFYIATGTYGRSEFNAHLRGENGGVSLYTPPGVAPTARERAIFDEFVAVFAGCRTLDLMSDRGVRR